MARPKNSEKYSTEAQRDLAKVITGEALAQLRKKLRQASVGELSNLVTKLLPVVLNEDTQTENDVSMELLAQKAARVSKRVKEANEKAKVEAKIEEEQS